MNETIVHIEKKTTLVPDLRFKEFNGEWGKRKLFEVANITTGSTPSTEADEYYGGNKLFVSPADISGNRYVHETKTTLTELGFEKGRRIKKGSVLFVCIGSTIGKVGQASEDCLTNQQINALDSNSDNSNDFLYSLLFKNGERIKSLAGVQAVPQINKTDFSNLFYYFPSLLEQQKIASFLSAVDEKIQQLIRKKELLEEYKTGVMQQIFSQQIRFKDADGKEFPEWAEKDYKEIYSFYPTNSLSRDNLNYESGEILNIHYGDIHTKFLTQFHLENEEVPFINPEVDVSKLKESSFCKEGDLVIADASEDYNDIGKCIELINLNGHKIVAGLHTFIARPDKYEMHVGFSGFLMQTWYVRKQIKTIAQGTKVLGISTNRLAKIKLRIPCIDEQRKITAFLTEIADNIERLNEEISQTQIFKKGLLQKMFV